MDKKIKVIINGSAMVGKDTFVEYCQKISRHILPIYSFSSVDKVKEAALILGWDGRKDEKGRKFLSDLKDLSSQYDGPLNYMKEELYKLEGSFLAFFMIREPNEIKKFCEKVDGVQTLLIKRDTKIHFNNHADIEIENYPYDFIIENNGDLEELRVKAYSFLLSILGK
jgi:hypothetical protein